MNRLILIDADILTYEMAFSVETPIYVVGGAIYKKRSTAEVKAKSKGLEVTKRKNIGSIQQIRMNLRAKLKTIFENLGTKEYEMYITASKVKDNFRAGVATLLPYKGNRIDIERPFHYETVRKMLMKDYGAILVTGQEADDMIGIRQYQLAEQYGDFDHTYIATIDKDLLMLEGNHYHLKEHKVIYQTAENALKHFYRQLLQGDQVDNIPGLGRLLKLQGREDEAKALIYRRPGYIRELHNYSLEHSSEECYNYVINMYKSYGFNKKEIEEIGRLLWIRRKENEMWEMPSEKTV